VKSGSPSIIELCSEHKKVIVHVAIVTFIVVVHSKVINRVIIFRIITIVSISGHSRFDKK